MIQGSINARIERGISLEERHARLGSFLASCQPPWAARAAVPPITFRANDASLYQSLGKAAPEGVTIWESLLIRDEWCYICDDTSTDDRLNVKITKKVIVRDFVRDFLPGLLTAFSAYECQFVTKRYSEWCYANPPTTYANEVVNQRRKVYFFGLINFWDRKLCERSWKCGPEEVARRLVGHVESAEVVGDGVLSVLSSKPIPLQAEVEANQGIIRLLYGRDK